LDLKAAAHFRGDTLFGVVVSLAWLGFAIAPVLVAGRYLAAEGWNQPRLLFLQAIWYWMDAVNWFFLSENMDKLRSGVTSGRTDGLLTLPVDSLLMASLGHLNVPDLPKFGIALALGGYAVWAGALPGGVLAVVGFVVALAAASVLFWAINVLCSFKVLTQFRFDGGFLASAVHNLSRVPTDLYNAGMRLLFSSVLPVVLLTTLPSRVFFGWDPLWLAAVSVAVTVAVVALTRWLWRREVARYVGLQG
jgi:ABC-2 type transport system permease protein